MVLKSLFIRTAALVICLHTPALSANYAIDNPAEKIYNPATDIKNPAVNIYNPATNLDNPSPISPPTQPLPQPAVVKPKAEEVQVPVKQVKEPPKPLPEITIPIKKYSFRTAEAYLAAAKNAFNRDDFVEFVSITEDALRRINAGTLRASKKTKQKLDKYKAFGYGLLGKGEK